jgi:hypothetical protein
MTKSADPTQEYPAGIETTTIAGIPVPVSCQDKIDSETLAEAASILDTHDIIYYQVSPVGGLKIYIGVHRSETTHVSVQRALDEIGHRLDERGVRNGFKRLRLGLIPPDFV